MAIQSLDNERKVNVMPFLWTPTPDLPKLMRESSRGSESGLKQADLIIYLDKVAIMFGKITENTHGVRFEVNLNACGGHFEITAVVVDNFIIPGSTIATRPYTLIKESQKFDYSKQGITCEIISKSAKIQPEFLWLGSLDYGIDQPSAAEIISTWRQFKPFYWDDTLVMTVTIIEVPILDRVTVEFHPWENILTSCPCPKHHGDYTTKTRGTIPKCLMPAPELTIIGGSGSSFYSYVIVPVLEGDIFLSPSEAGSIQDGPSSLSPDNYIHITWDPFPDAIRYRVFRLEEAYQTSPLPLPMGLICEIDATDPLECDDVGFTMRVSDRFNFLDELAYHTYTKPGTYVWTVTVTMDGQKIRRTGTIEIKPRPLT